MNEQKSILMDIVDDLENVKASVYVIGTAGVILSKEDFPDDFGNGILSISDLIQEKITKDIDKIKWVIDYVTQQKTL